MKIEAIGRMKGRRGWVELRVEDLTIALPIELAATAHLHAGDEVSHEELLALQARAEAWRCKQAALTLLAHRPRSCREMRDRLLRREIPPGVVDACISDLLSASLLDDGAFALAFALDRLRGRPTGRSRLILELRGRGVDGKVAERAVDEAMGELESSDLALARRAARKFKRRTGEDIQRARRRLYSLLARRGFGSETAMTVLDEELSEG